MLIQYLARSEILYRVVRLRLLMSGAYCNFLRGQLASNIYVQRRQESIKYFDVKTNKKKRNAENETDQFVK